MEFLIQHNLLNEKQLLLIKEGVQDLPHQFVGLIPFSREVTSNEPLEGKNFIPYGSTSFMIAAQEQEWKGLHYDPKKFNYRAATKHRTDMLNGDTIETVGKAIWWLREVPYPGAEMFIRPSDDLKLFSGQVMKVRDMVKFLGDAMKAPSSASEQLFEETEIVLAKPKPIEGEWRWFIVGGKVISGSCYRYKGELVKAPETSQLAINKAQEMADIWLPDDCCVMDLAMVEGEGMKVIEFNCINASGFYAHDVKAIFHALYNYHKR